MTLKQEIDNFVSEMAGRIPPQILDELKRSIDGVKASGITERALTVGDSAPGFTLPNALTSCAPPA